MPASVALVAVAAAVVERTRTKVTTMARIIDKAVSDVMTTWEVIFVKARHTSDSNHKKDNKDMILSVDKLT